MKENIPAYTAQYPNLAKHLESVKSLDRHKRNNYIKKMQLPEMAEVVMEMREAIINDVQHKIGQSKLPLVFLIGNTGSGKSTSLCYLRGDEMTQNSSLYYSSKDDDQGLIGHDIADSRTFLPNVEVLSDFILIDFPGFEDTNGALIGFGMELALRALITQYPSKVLVIESITNTESRFNNVELLAARIGRLFNNPEECVLGLTKYSQKVATPKVIKEDEEQFLKITKFRQLMSFNKLEGTELRETYNGILSSASTKSLERNPQLILDPDTQTLINEGFAAYLKNMYSGKTSNQSHNYANLAELYQQVSKSSFIEATQNDQLCKFLQLPEMPQEFIKEFDKQLVEYCFRQYMQGVININLIKLRNNISTLEKTVHTLVLEESVLALEGYARGLLGIRDTNNQDWATYLTRHGKFDQPLEELFKFPDWIESLPFISTQLPKTAYSLAREPELGDNQHLTQEMIEACVQEIEQIHDTLYSFSQMKNMVNLNMFYESQRQTEDILTLEPFPRKEAKIFKLLMLNRFIKSHDALNSAIRVILDKANILEKKGFTKEAESIHDLIETIIIEANIYKNAPSSAASYKSFSEKTSPALKKTGDVLKEHRGYNHILANIALAIAGLGIFYGIAAVVNRVQTGNWLFFNKTDSAKKLDDVTDALDRIKPKQ